MPVKNQTIISKKFDDHLTQTVHKPEKGIITALDSNRIPFNKNILFSHNPSMFSALEWNRCVEFFLEKTPYGTLTDIMNVSREINMNERPHIKDLEQLAIDIVREMYDIPEYITMIAEIGNPSGSDLEGDGEIEEQEELSKEQKAKIEPYIQKRIILNSLMHGAAIHQWVSAFYLGHEKLNELNVDLIDNYNDYASMINYYNWKHTLAILPEDMFNMMFGINQAPLNNGNNNNQNQAQPQQPQQGQQDQNGGGMTQGYNKVDIENREIKAVGINFAILIHELSKGALEFLLARGIPEDLSEEELQYMYDKADKYSYEFWHYYMGPTFWRALINAFDVETQELPSILSHISLMEYEELSDFFIQIIDAPDGEVKKTINNIKKQIKNESN